MALELYRKKRDFAQTPEPKGRASGGRKKAKKLSFVIQKHKASHLHYDFRLELDSVLLSWAVPKGPSLDPNDRRLALHVEDHPIEYGDFEGVIPPNQYGSGTVLLWDRGIWAPTDADPAEAYRKGKLKFQLEGEKLHGGWILLRTSGGKYGAKGNSWFLIKADDEFARSGPEAHVDERPLSVASGRSLEEIAADPERVWHSNKSVADNVKNGTIKKPPTPGLDLSRLSGARKKPVAKSAQDSGDETIAGVKLTHPEKLLYPEKNLSKRDLALYYTSVADWIVPHLAHRPLTLVRCPSGWQKQCFYQKHAHERVPEGIEQIEIREAEGPGIYMMANSITAVVGLLQMGVLELHPWGSQQKTLDRPDRIIFDFDPDEGLGWPELVKAVQVVKSLLDKVGLESFLKTTGGKGLHVVLPLEPKADWDTVKRFTKGVAELMVQTFPDRFTSKVSKSKRDGKIFIDYLRNAKSATAIAPFSLRAKANAPVATPIAWTELKGDLRFDHFNVSNVPDRLKRMKNDPWADFFAVRQAITRPLLRKLGLG